MGGRVCSVHIALAGCVLAWTPALAAPQTWVSRTGSNTGTCTIASPCRTLQYALSQTSNGGTINVLTSGNFGGVTINKSVTIQAEGVVARSNGVLINAPTNRAVTLRGLIFDRNGDTSHDVVRFLQGQSLLVEKCVVRRGRYGIRFQPAAGQSKLTVSDTTVELNVATGVWVKNGVSGTLVAELDRVRAFNNTAGIGFETQGSNARIRASVADTVTGGNGGAGLYALRMDASSPVHVLAERVTTAANGKGLEASGAEAAISFSDSTITGNTTGLSSVSGGQLVSFGNNRIRGNTTDGAPTSTVAQQ